jgi:hypothetical protein
LRRRLRLNNLLLVEYRKVHQDSLLCLQQQVDFPPLPRSPNLHNPKVAQTLLLDHKLLKENQI